MEEKLRATPAARSMAKKMQVDLSMISGTGAKGRIHKEDVLDLVRTCDFDVLVVLGAGDLDNYVSQMAKIIESK